MDTPKPVDIGKLTAGQKVVLRNKPLAGLGTVIKVSPEEVIVQIDLATGPMPENSRVRFDANGHVCNSRDLGYRGPEEKETGLPCSWECSTPWELMQGTVDDFFNAQGNNREETVADFFESQKRYQ